MQFLSNGKIAHFGYAKGSTAFTPGTLGTIRKRIMYIQEISIDIKSKINKNELIDAFDLLISFYRGSGQIQGNIQTQYIANNKVVCLPYSLEKESLDKKFNSLYVNRQIDKIEKLCNSKLKIKIAGKSYESYKTTCKCEKSDFYILITNYISIDSPLTCGTCNKSVPLYRLPVYYDYGYMPILSWATNYISCDSLQMNCEVGERWALKQMQEINSQLSKQGLEICRRVEELTSISTFYYLYNYKKISNENQSTRLCPNCNEEWILKKKLHNFYDYKCDRCKIISTMSQRS